MVDMFEKKMCNYCKNKNCQKKILINEEKNLITYKCYDYIKDSSKITPYVAPLVVTAEKEF